MLSKRFLVSLALAASAFFTLWHWWTLSQPVILVDALTDRLSCVSYSPYHKPGQTPLKPTSYIEAGQIEADLKALAQRFDCVRTYSLSQGLHEVPRLAKQFGMKVLLGAWIGRRIEDNEREVIRAIDLARKYPDTIRAVIIGNEVLLRGEQSASAIKSYLERVKSAVSGVPVSYADVWEFWLRHQHELKDVVSFATVHILPYWEDRPVAIENAVGHVSHIYQHVKDELQGKPVMIGETGWPSFGRQRQGAKPSLVNQARFIREFAVRSKLESIDYNAIEAFDQPWKQIQEGAAGGYWGLFDTAGNPKFPFHGPVAEAPRWGLAAFGMMGVLFVIFALLARDRLNTQVALALLAVSVIGGGACVGYFRDIWMTNRNPLEWTYTGIYGVFLFAAVFCYGIPLASWCSKGHQPPDVAPFSHLVLWARRNDRSFDGTARLLGGLRFAFIFGGGLACLLLVFDARYRDYPLALYSVPALFLVLLSWVKEKATADLEEMFLAVWIGFAGLWIALFEHVVIPRDGPWQWADGLNPYSFAWAGICLMLAASLLGPVSVKLYTGKRQKIP